MINDVQFNIVVCLIVWAGAQQSRSPGAKQTTLVQVYQLPMDVDGPASPALNAVLSYRHQMKFSDQFDKG